MRRGLKGVMRLATLLGSLFALAVGVEAQSVTDFVKKSELESAVERWRKAQEFYYSTLYEKELGIAVSRDASDFLVGRYVERKPLPGTVIERGADVVRIAIRMDLESVLNRSFSDEVTERHGSFGQFLVQFTAGKVRKVEIDKKRVEGTVEKGGCRVIPCDPAKCDPNSCAESSVDRFVPKTK